MSRPHLWVKETSGVRMPRRQSFLDVKHACQSFIREREEKGLMKPARFQNFEDFNKPKSKK